MLYSAFIILFDGLFYILDFAFNLVSIHKLARNLKCNMNFNGEKKLHHIRLQFEDDWFKKISNRSVLSGFQACKQSVFHISVSFYCN